jgi:hypothetical protein
MTSKLIPTHIIYRPENDRYGLLLMLEDEIPERMLGRHHEAHRALRSLPPELMFVGYGQAKKI